MLSIFQEIKRQVICVFLEDLYTSLDCQEWLDIQCLDQVTITAPVINVLFL